MRRRAAADTAGDGLELVVGFHEEPSREREALAVDFGAEARTVCAKQALKAARRQSEASSGLIETNSVGQRSKHCPQKADDGLALAERTCELVEHFGERGRVRASQPNQRRLETGEYRPRGRCVEHKANAANDRPNEARRPDQCLPPHALAQSHAAPSQTREVGFEHLRVDRFYSAGIEDHVATTRQRGMMRKIEELKQPRDVLWGRSTPQGDTQERLIDAPNEKVPPGKVGSKRCAQQTVVTDDRLERGDTGHGRIMERGVPIATSEMHASKWRVPARSWRVEGADRSLYPSRASTAGPRFRLPAFGSNGPWLLAW
jgi:hypothetical protein